MYINKYQVKLLLVISLIIIAYSPQAFTQTPPTTSSPELSSFFNTALWQSVAVAVLSAILAFITGYVLAGISKKQRSGKKLAYSLLIENGLIKIEKNIRDKVKVLYNRKEIENLYNIIVKLENIGNTVVKAQEIRFEFPNNITILDFYFDPEPEQEMKVEKIDTGLRAFERKCKIGQIERGQSLGICFTATSKLEIQDDKVKLHPFNESGDVEFTSRSVIKALSTRDQIAKFLSMYIFYITIPPIFDALFNIGNIMAGVTRFIILLFMVRLIVPVSKIVGDIICKLMSKNDKSINIQGSVSNSAIGGDKIRIYNNKDLDPSNNISL